MSITRKKEKAFLQPFSLSLLVKQMDNVQSENKKHSTTKIPKQFLEVVDQWADGIKTSYDLPMEIIRIAQEYQIPDDVARSVIESALRVRHVPERTIQRVLPSHLKRHYDSSSRKPPIRQMAKSDPELPQQNNTEDIQPTYTVQTPEPNAGDVERGFVGRGQQQQQQQDPQQLQDEIVFSFLRNRHNGINIEYHEELGIKLWESTLSQFKNRGIKKFKRLYFEV